MTHEPLIEMYGKTFFRWAKHKETGKDCFIVEDCKNGFLNIIFRANDRAIHISKDKLLITENICPV